MESKSIRVEGRVDLDFSDGRGETDYGGAALLGEWIRRLGLRGRLLKAISIKERKRGADEAEAILSLTALMMCGLKTLSRMDDLRKDRTFLELLGFKDVPGSRRMGEFLRRFTDDQVAALAGQAQWLGRQMAADIVKHPLAVFGYVPMFIDGSGIEFLGRLFERAGIGYNGKLQYWLHCLFVGGMWAVGKLQPGGGSVTEGWMDMLNLAAAMLPPYIGSRVWLTADSAYYRGDMVRHLDGLGWGYSISVTDPNKRRPVLEPLEGLKDSAWTHIGRGEYAILSRHRPAGWHRECDYVVTRRPDVDKDGKPKWIYTVTLVGRADLPVAELVRRHRGKQGQENLFKVPLNDMGLHHPRCRSFRANQVIYLCAQMAQMLLRMIQRRSLPKEAQRHGIQTIISEIMLTKARLVRHARRRTLLFCKQSCRRLDWLLHAVLYFYDEHRRPA